MAKRQEISDAPWELIKPVVSPEQKKDQLCTDDHLILHGGLWVINEFLEIAAISMIHLAYHGIRCNRGLLILFKAPLSTLPY